jgi:hypothetical protein
MKVQEKIQKYLNQKGYVLIKSNEYSVEKWEEVFENDNKNIIITYHKNGNLYKDKSYTNKVITAENVYYENGGVKIKIQNKNNKEKSINIMLYHMNGKQIFLDNHITIGMIKSKSILNCFPRLLLPIDYTNNTVLTKEMLINNTSSDLEWLVDNFFN